MSYLIPVIILMHADVFFGAPEILWSKTYDGAWFYDVHETSSGNIVAAGEWSDGSSVMLFDSAGQFLWSAGGGYVSERSYSVEEIPGSGFIATGSSKSSASARPWM